MLGASIAAGLAALLLVACLGGAAGMAESSKDQLHKLVDAVDESGAESPLSALPFERERELKEDYHATMNRFLDRFERQQAEQSKKKSAKGKEGSKSGLLERLIGTHRENKCGVNETSGRENLVVLPAGDDFDASRWMNDPDRSNWDIIIMYFGKNKNYVCPLCKAVYRAAGPKWRLVWGFTLLSEWEEYRQRYAAIMFPDDDLTLDVCTINTVFSVMKAYELLAAQPSLCDAQMSFTQWRMLYQQKQTILRYTTMIEIMAPAFEMDYFHNFIRPSLYNAHVGWGLDFVWPFLLRYPRDKIAVVDQVCMFHPPSAPNKANSVYSAEAPYRKKEEETRRFAEYGYFESEIEKLGMHFMIAEVLGAVPKPEPQQSLLETGHEVLQTRLGSLYPLLLLLQSAIILVGCLGMLRAKVRGRWQQLALARKVERGEFLPLIAAVEGKKGSNGGMTGGSGAKGGNGFIVAFRD